MLQHFILGREMEGGDCADVNKDHRGQDVL